MRLMLKKTIRQNPQLYIHHKNISLVKFGKKARYIKEDDLPIETLLGSSYLINGKNILETYTWCDNAHSYIYKFQLNTPCGWVRFILLIQKKTTPKMWSIC